MEKSMRSKWLEYMLKIVSPVLENLSTGSLHKSIPVAFHSFREKYILLEAFGRSICGMAPWLELEGLEGEERVLQEKYRVLARTCMDKAFNPQSPDFMNFCMDGRPLVDTAFLAHGILRAPKQLFFKLEEKIQKNVIEALKSSRKIVPCVTNWLLFSAMVEAALYCIGEKDYDLVRVEYAVNMFQNWYLGDGTYGDGPEYHWDYYNSFVIQPMFVDILRTFCEERREYKELLPAVEERASRYAQVLERMIAPDGTYPILGRSVTYRFGVFQMLSQAALENLLPKALSAGQVRCALNAVIEKVMESRTMFDKDGWLQPGVYGRQPDLAEAYISVGSLYLCSTVFLPLGLSPQHGFWMQKNRDWTGKRIWSGVNQNCDHAI